MRAVYLVRHGRVHNPDGVVYGRLPGFDLSSAGRLEVLAAAERLRGSALCAIWTSPLQRATSTAELIRDGRDLPIRLDSRLTEVGTAQQGRRHQSGPPNDGRIRLGPERPFPDALELVVEIRARMLATIRDAFAAPGTGLALVGHQVPIAIAIRALGLSEAVVPDVPEASVIELRQQDGGWVGGLLGGRWAPITDPTRAQAATAESAR